MDRKNIFLIASLLSLMIMSCGERAVQCSRGELVGKWVDDEAMLVLLDDSTFVANNIFDVKIALGTDTIVKNGNTYVVNKFQTTGVIGRWRLVSNDSIGSKIELMYCSNCSDTDGVTIKEIDVFESNFCGMEFLNLKVYSQDSTQCSDMSMVLSDNHKGVKVYGRTIINAWG